MPRRPARTNPRLLAPPPPQSDERGLRIFVPPHALVAACCILAGFVTGLLVWLTPAVWPPVGAGIAMTCLGLALYGLWHSRHRN